MYHLPNDAWVIGERWSGYINGRHRSILYNCVVSGDYITEVLYDVSTELKTQGLVLAPRRDIVW